MAAKVQKVTLGVFRNDYRNQDNIEEHRNRAKLMHAMVDGLGIKATGWSQTDSKTPHEFTAIILALGTAGVFQAVVSIVKAWLDRDKIPEVELSCVGQKPIVLTKATRKDVVAIAKAIGYKIPEATVLAKKGGTKKG